jgi:pimeloyl-ACP methyl ester carboxylesterase
VITHRLYGSKPPSIAVIHGGPGARGDIAPVAHELAAWGLGVIEPLQAAQSVETQIAELADTLREHANAPVALIGHSWGAWLAALTAAAHPDLASQVIHVSGGPLEAHYAKGIRDTRISRLSESEAAEFRDLMARLAAGDTSDGEAIVARLTALCEIADVVAHLPGENPDALDFDAEAFGGVWPQAARMRETGELLQRFATIAGPVTAIHGADDPHPADGVRLPLLSALPSARFVLLERCGHTPWRERHARDGFYAALRAALGV